MECAVSTLLYSAHTHTQRLRAVDDDVLCVFWRIFAALNTYYIVDFFSVAVENSISLFLREEFIIIIQMNVGAA